jgi:hypothetical protein
LPARNCVELERRLPAGREHALMHVATSYDAGVAAIDGGNVAVVRNFHVGGMPSANGGLYLRRAGSRRFLKLSSDYAGPVAIDHGRLLYMATRVVADETVVRARRLRGGPWIELVRDSGADEDTHGSATVSVLDAALDGNYAYWLLSSSPEGSESFSTVIERVNLASPHASVEQYRPLLAPAGRLAVDRGTIYYAPAPGFAVGGGVYQVTNPTWSPTDQALPVRG